MINYNKPSVHTIPNPAGLDAALLLVQYKLALLPWLEKIYGCAYPQTEKRKKDNDRTDSQLVFPEIWNEKMEPFNLMPNDNIKRAYSFFVQRDPATFENYEAGDTDLIIRQPMSLIIWCNLQEIDSNKPYRYKEELKKAILKSLLKAPQFELDTTYERYDKVFEQFTITETYRQYLKPPYWAIRIDFDITYNEFADTCEAAQQEIDNSLFYEDGAVTYFDASTIEMEL